ncbi:putative alternative thymidylate synthase [Estrella lausannensis]|uniref:Putative alternative thymidylate synthase n=1 Tax=Estrella lausannensis TaxID=483423 RepID=A0A0H5DSN2_9BACT|nr:FAD-dependent thymidylate synthase [Estrella lausannensis]CRX38799.1 putative alternative thymidylate synthase [Estrella lausannensis]
MLLDDYEDFNDEQINTLDRYVTNTKGHVFALKNLPEVIKGALFSRYSRSSLGLRSLLIKEFISNEDESQFQFIAGQRNDTGNAEQAGAIKKAQNFYDRILDGYGDDSIGELGGAHLAIENVSMLAAKEVEDSRIGGSPLEKSTRYIYFDQKVKGEYLFYREPILMTSAWRGLYIDTCNMLFETYGRLIPVLTKMIEATFPKDPAASKAAYTAALRAKVLDCLRGLLPAGTLTNMGIFGNGRFFEGLIHKLHCHSLAEMQELGKRSHEELSKVIPSFVRRSDLLHHTHQAFERYAINVESQIKNATKEYTAFPDRSMEPGVFLVDSDQEAELNVAAAILFAHSNKSIEDIKTFLRGQGKDEIERILEAAAASREHRRHKSPRALEHAFFTFDITADFGAYRDLHRHRMLTQERQLLSCDYGYCIPPEIEGTELEADYVRAMEQAKEAFDTIRQEFPEEAQYIVPMAYHVRWYFKINLRGLQWLTELRSAAAGHPNYRYIAQRMAKLVAERHPLFERFFKFVDFNGYDLGRLGQEERRIAKQGFVDNR